jgi:RNA polymerase sigma-70 factor (ECF subfamily)
VSQDSELTDLPDDALVLRFRAMRDNLFFTVLYRRHVREVFLRISRVLREHRVQATDLAQDTFLKAYANIDSYNGGDFRAWLLRIARNECLNYLQSARVRREVITDQTPEPALARWMGDGNAAYSLDTLAVINQLSAPQRVCIKLWSEGYRFEEIARLTNLPAGAVRSHIQNGKLRFGALWGTRT